MVKIGELGVGHVGNVILGKLSNPCLDYVEYMEQNHPGEISRRDLDDMRRTYQLMPDPDVARECLLTLRLRQQADAKAARRR